MSQSQYFKIALALVLLVAAESAVVQFRSIDFATPTLIATSPAEISPNSFVQIIDVDKATPPAMKELHSVVASFAADVPPPKFDFDLGLRVIHPPPMYLGVEVGVSPPMGVLIEGGLGTEVLRTLRAGYREIQSFESLFIPRPKVKISELYAGSFHSGLGRSY